MSGGPAEDTTADATAYGVPAALSTGHTGI